MRKLLSFILLSLTGLVLLGAVALGLFLSSFNPNDYKQRVCSAVEKATGRQLQFEGDLVMSFFPSLSLKTGRLILNDPGEFGAEPFASVDSATLNVALEPLLEGMILVEEITLHGPRLKLSTTTAGKHNWEHGFGDKRAAGAPADPTQSDAAASASGSLHIPDVVPLTDERPGTASRAAAASSGTGGKSFILRVSRISCTDARIVYRDMRHGTSWTGRLDTVTIGDARLDADMPFTLSGVGKDDISASSAAFTLAGTAHVAERGMLTVAVHTLEVKADGIGSVPLTLRAAGNVIYDAATRLTRIDGVSGELIVPEPAEAPGRMPEERSGPLRTEFSGKADMTPSEGDRPARCTGELHVGTLDLDTLLNRVNPPSPLADTQNVPGAPNLTRPTVNKVKRSAYPPRGFPSADANGRGAAGGNPGAAASGGVLPAANAQPAALDLDIALTAENVTARTLPVKNIRATLQYKGRQALLPYEASLFDGALSGTLRLDLRKDEPTAALLCTINNLDMEQATAALSKKCIVSGSLGATLQINGHGRSSADIMHSLDGNVAVQAQGGAIRGFSLIPANLPHSKALPAEIPFERMSASAKINQGVATTNDIALQSKLLTARGGGVVHLAYGQLDLGIDFLPAGKPPAVPVGISGPYNALSSSVDMRTFLRNVGETALGTPETPQGIIREVGGMLFRQ